MPRALPLPRREQIVALRQSGHSLVEIAASLALPYRTVRGIWARYRHLGAAGLAAQYARCGPPGVRFPQPLYAAALATKQEHPRWGGELIRLQLAEQFPGAPLPHKRTLQRWFREAGLVRGRARQPPVERARGKTPHAVWQVDAKERLRLGNGEQTSVLTVTDEASGALLGIVPFPPVSLDPGSRRGGAAGAAGPF